MNLPPPPRIWVDPYPRSCAESSVAMPRRAKVGVVLAALVVAGSGLRAANAPSAAQPAGVQITQLPDRLRVEVNGRLFTEYFFKDVPRPYFYPIIGPGGV